MPFNVNNMVWTLITARKDEVPREARTRAAILGGLAQDTLGAFLAGRSASEEAKKLSAEADNRRLLAVARPVERIVAEFNSLDDATKKTIVSGLPSILRLPQVEPSPGVPVSVEPE